MSKCMASAAAAAAGGRNNGYEFFRPFAAEDSAATSWEDMEGVVTADGWPDLSGSAGGYPGSVGHDIAKKRRSGMLAAEPKGSKKQMAKSSEDEALPAAASSTAASKRKNSSSRSGKGKGSSSNSGSADTAATATESSLPPPKTEYIHVRARRGQATDSHSLAERVRRERISERMKYLQELVPGCNKVAGKAGMLDEIINYVKSLQQQVEFLSMKLAAVSSSAAPPPVDGPGSIEELLMLQQAAAAAAAACYSNPGGYPLHHLGSLEQLSSGSGAGGGAYVAAVGDMSDWDAVLQHQFFSPSFDHPFQGNCVLGDEFSTGL